MTAVEEIVASVFAEALGVDRVGLDDDFFALGGNSLIATRVAARLGQALDAQVPVRVCSRLRRWSCWLRGWSRRSVRVRGRR